MVSLCDQPFAPFLDTNCAIPVCSVILQHCSALARFHLIAYVAALEHTDSESAGICKHRLVALGRASLSRCLGLFSQTTEKVLLSVLAEFQRLVRYSTVFAKAVYR